MPRISRLAATAVLALAATGLTVPAASAASTGSTASSAPAAAEEAAPLSTSYQGTYPSFEKCRAVGMDGRASGLWNYWICYENSVGNWDLYVDDQCVVCLASGSAAAPRPADRDF